MRVSSLYLPSLMNQSLERSGNAIYNLQEQVSSGRKINQPSDDPIVSAQLINLQRESREISQYQSNIKRISTSFSQQETQVSAILSQTDLIHGDLVSAANSTNSTVDLKSLSQTIDGKIEAIVASLNQKNEDGHAMFAGTMTDHQAVILDPQTGRYYYNGNEEQRVSTVANGINIAENTLMGDAFSKSGSTLDVLNTLAALSQKMKLPKQTVSGCLSDINAQIVLVDQCAKNLGGKLTDLGIRQNRLTQLDDAHTDIATVRQTRYRRSGQYRQRAGQRRYQPV
ncbi:flagellar hook-associated protein FlgL [Rouxiella chamberiensis]|uniref:Flagellar hook-associated protein FlgL n=1 Tax=Rouxiella chamberiensis TaxID=1513468 RepID=A0ABY7HMP7_9GAMM|nr:flagellar hook-associated protein FlgL [Rouxiella chamberiensis]WAT00650.1 flagellar hook-associated protein FlgL [Rouxiella chamberiensis]